MNKPNLPASSRMQMPATKGNAVAKSSPKKTVTKSTMAMNKKGKSGMKSKAAYC